MAEKFISPHPFVKWVGGKRQLLGHIHKIMPTHYERYFEPFVGGGAVFFDITPPKAVLNDINTQLMATYKWLKDKPDNVLTLLDKYDNAITDDGLNKLGAKELFYQLREKYNKKLETGINDEDTAALLIWLNKHCFNGLYRCNSKGLFNVPYANTRRTSYSKDNISAVSEALKAAEIIHGDFEKVCDRAETGDFVFLDSPYAPVKANSFVDYTQEGFSKEDHERLAEQFKKLTKRGCYCILTNHNTDFINSLYKGFNKLVVQVKRSINRNANGRKGEEIIIWNYNIA